MQSPRRVRFLARFVLAVFALALGVAVASPMVHPQSMELVCSSGGAMKLIVKSAAGVQDASSTAGSHSHTLDCPLCISAWVAPPTVLVLPTAAPSALSHVLQPVESARIAGRVAAPLPPRGPPTFS